MSKLTRDSYHSKLNLSFQTTQLFLISLAFFLNEIAPINFVQNNSQYVAYMAAHIPANQSTSETTYQIILGELTLRGLITSMIGYLEYKIFEKLSELLRLAWKKLRANYRKKPRRKRRQNY